MGFVVSPVTELLRLSHRCFLNTTTDNDTFGNAVTLIPSALGYITCSTPTLTLSTPHHPQQR
jgi:hypothetical protein